MDPINPISGNPEALNQNPQPSANSNGITILSMALFILLSLGVIVFLYYQNQQLKSMITNNQPVPSASPSANILPNDNTANWETYINASKDYSIKHPTGLKTETNVAGEGEENVRFVYMGASQIATGRTQTELSDGYFILITRLGKASQFSPKTEIAKQLANSKENCNQDNATVSAITQIKVAGTSASQYSASCMSDYTVTYLSDNKNTYSITQFYTNKDYRAVTDQILSTFKFTEATSSASPIPVQKACTMEAKICPDGSSVGRTGPNCEFAACPTR